jgi:hypothetical protein
VDSGWVLPPTYTKYRIAAASVLTFIPCGNPGVFPNNKLAVKQLPLSPETLLPLDTFGNGNRTHRQIILGSEDKQSVVAQAGMDWQKVIHVWDVPFLSHQPPLLTKDRSPQVLHKKDFNQKIVLTITRYSSTNHNHSP